MGSGCLMSNTCIPIQWPLEVIQYWQDVIAVLLNDVKSWKRHSGAIIFSDSHMASVRIYTCIFHHPYTPQKRVCRINTAYTHKSYTVYRRTSNY